jgi:hypothetical protein
MAGARGERGVYRRALLAGLAAAAGATGLAGCAGDLPRATGPRGPPTSPGPPPTDGAAVSVTDIDVEPADDGSLTVLATVENRGDGSATREVVATVTLDDEEFVRSTTVRVGAGATREVGVGFDLSFDAFSAGGSVSVDLR